jgi:hypothetical protein
MKAKKIAGRAKKKKPDRSAGKARFSLSKKKGPGAAKGFVPVPVRQTLSRVRP